MRTVRTVALALVALPVAACAVVGPQGIRGGRSVYNEAIGATNSEQILAMIVSANRCEPVSLLRVASVTANARVQTNVGAQFGIGPESTFAGNLVPLSAGALYEENPTIVYLPVDGAEFLRSGLSPLPLDMAVLIMGGLGTDAFTWSFLIKSVSTPGGRELAAAVAPDTTGPMEEVGELLAALQRRGDAVWLQDGGGAAARSRLMLVARSNAGREEIEKVRALLGVRGTIDPNGRLFIDLKLGAGESADGSLVLLTRSPFELLRLAGHGVEHTPPAESGGDARSNRFMRVLSSESRPASALVAIEQRGRWYWIDEHDDASRRTFWLLSAILNARMADSATGQGTPVLTTPTSR